MGTPNVDKGTYYQTGAGETKRSYRKVKRNSTDDAMSKRQRRDRSIAKRTNIVTAATAFYKQNTTQVKKCCADKKCIISLIGHADASEEMSLEKLTKQNEFLRQVCATR